MPRAGGPTAERCACLGFARCTLGCCLCTRPPCAAWLCTLKGLGQFRESDPQPSGPPGVAQETLPRAWGGEGAAALQSRLPGSARLSPALRQAGAWRPRMCDLFLTPEAPAWDVCVSFICVWPPSLHREWVSWGIRRVAARQELSWGAARGPYLCLSCC